MSLQFVFGRAGTGKTDYCFQKIKEQITKTNKIYLITPEQFSYMQEKRLLESIETNAVLNAEVITFNRMLDRISCEVGGIYESLITKSSKAMLVYSILQDKKDELNYLGKSDENLELAIKTITEFKKHNVVIKNLEQNVKEVEDQKLKLKLNDMLLIYSEYEKQIKSRFIDEDDRLTRLAKLLEKSNMFQDALVFIDEFAGFTAQEYEILKQIMKKAKEVTITACVDYNADTIIFEPNKQVIEKITNIAKEANVNIEQPIILKEIHRFKNKELKHLEANIYENTYKKYNEDVKNICLFLANNPYTEIEYVAKQITKLVREENYKFNDISIITKDIDNISSIAKAVFTKYNIPIFMDEKEELSQNIAVKYILSILDIFSKNWSQDAVLTFIKLGFLPLEQSDIYKLEKYIKKWGIRGNKWYKEDWTYEEDLEEINNLRKQIVEPLISFKEDLSRNKTPKDISRKIVEFLDENSFYSKLNEKIKILEKNNELKKASDYKQSIDGLIQVLDEIVEIFGDKKISFEKYSDILKIGLKYKELGSIPQTIDQVILGDVDRSRTHKVKACFVIGVNDGVFPGINKNEGFFNDDDREYLKKLGTELAKGTLEMLYDEEFNIYKAITLAEEKLFLSYISSNFDGASLRRSVIITKIKKIFSQLKEESDVIQKLTDISIPESTFNDLLYNLRQFLDGEEIDEKWFDVYNWYNNSKIWHERLQKALFALSHTNLAQDISMDNIQKLYGNTLKTSVSKLEQYRECPFSFHLKYGLKLQETEEYKIKSIDTGSFMHEIVDTFFETIGEKEFTSLTKNDVTKKVYDIIEEKLNLKKNAIFTSSPKFVLLTERLKKVVTESIFYIVYQMQNSNFKILGNEVEFAEKIDNVELTGKIDRLDTASGEDGEYIRIIDYKSSTKNLDLNKMIAGLQIQLITYIDAIAKKTKGQPAGMFYFNLIDPIISKNRNLSDDEIEKEIRKAFKMKGLILSDIKIVKMMDKTLDVGTSENIPVTIDKNGDISKLKSSTLTKEEFTLLQKKAEKIIKQISKEILNGKIEIKPTYDVKQKKSACEYCPYKAICSFNQKENTYSYIQNKTKDEIFEDLKKE